MSSGAPAKKTVRKTGPTQMDKCDSAIPGICLFSQKGPVQTYLIVDDNQQLHVCQACFEQLVLAGQWVEQP